MVRPHRYHPEQLHGHPGQYHRQCCTAEDHGEFRNHGRSNRMGSHWLHDRFCHLHAGDELAERGLWPEEGIYSQSGMFVLGSALCGAAWGKDSLIVFRIIQAIGGGAMMPTGLTLVSETFPPYERGTAMGIWSIGMMVGPAVGPFLGGYLVDEVSWRAIFYVNLPVGAMAILAAHLILSAQQAPRTEEKI